MRRGWIVAAMALWLAPAAAGQQLVDRIVARVGDDVITQSELSELGRYQQLVDGKEQPTGERLRELVEQWIVSREASLSGFSAPGKQDVEKTYADLEKRFGTAEAFRKRLQELGLSESEVRHLLARQLFLSRYLDYKFRPEVQVAERQIEEYYRKTLVPELQRAGQRVPTLESVADQVREVLMEQGINRRAAQWLDEMRARWKVEMVGGDPAQ
jgi:peptidyl-prolyl cis-trans isomerase SurA